MEGKRSHFRLTSVAQKRLCLTSLTTSKERLQKFHTDDVSLPENWIIKATSFPGSLSCLSLLSRTGRREPWERVNWVTWLKKIFLAAPPINQKNYYTEIWVLHLSPPQSLFVLWAFCIFLGDYCYFYRNTQLEPPQRREVLRVISMEFLCSFLRRHWW